MAVYVFGIGGTGSRILRALTLLLASGANAGEHQFIPISIDVDNTNKDTERSLDSFINYIKFKKSINTQDSYKQTIRTIDKNVMDNIDTIDRRHFQINLSEHLNGNFANYIGFNELDAIDKEFFKSLYSESMVDTYTDREGAAHAITKELYLNLNDGFKGRPNIGCIAFNELAKKQEFIDIINDIAATPTNKIIVVGSIFGGTGSSGLPQLIQILNNYKEQPQTKNENNATITGTIDNIPLCAINVYPYYQVKSNSNGVTEIVSSKFISKSKNALKYYLNFKRPDRFYHIYDNPLHQFEYNVGGGDQENKALWTEIIGAYGILQFANNGTRRTDNDSTQHFAYSSYFPDNTDGNTLPQKEIHLSNFHATTKTDIIYPLIKMGIRWYVLNTFLARNDLDTKPFYSNIHMNISNNIDTITSLKNELNWFKDYFIEIQSTSRNLKLFDFTRDTLYGFLILQTNIDIDTDDIYQNRTTLYENLSAITNPKEKIYKFTENLAIFYFNKLNTENAI